MSYFDGIKECEDLVTFALEGVTEPTTIYDQSPCNRIALRLVAIKFDEHNFIIFSYVRDRAGYRYAVAITHAKRALLRQRRHHSR